VSACGSKEACDVVGQTGCDDDQICEAVTGSEETICATPFVLRGGVFDLTSAGQPVVTGARVVAIDGNGAPASAVAASTARQSLAYTGDFEPGVFYQVRVVSLDNSGVPLSSTEDLRGVFQAEVP
jgi:hypothetical protein